MSQRLAERFYTLVFRKNVDFIEVLSGLLMFGWGFQLLLPWSTFSTSPGYMAMSLIAPEPVWGGVLIWVGFTQIGSYLLQHWRVRLASTLGAAMIWAFLAVLFVISNPYGTSIVMYPGVAIFTGWTFLRVFMAGPGDD